MKLRRALQSDMNTIYNTAIEYNLESDDMKAEEFTVAEESNQIIGFGRLKVHPDVVELGTIGVIEEYRHRGVATEIINKLLEKTNSDVYLTTLMPKFFEKFGFETLEASASNSLIRSKEWCEGCSKKGCTVMKKRSPVRANKPFQ